MQEKAVDKYKDALQNSKYEFEKKFQCDYARTLEKKFKEVKDMWAAPDHGRKKWKLQKELEAKQA